jgi:hypothetical protein
MKSRYNWNIYLSGHYNNLRYFQKILVTSKGINTPGNLINKNIATVIPGRSSYGYINYRFLKPLGLSSKKVRLISVSKDFDAIMALGFGQVDGAIITWSSFNRIIKINPTLLRKIKILKELPAISYPYVVKFPDSKDSNKMRYIFGGIGNSNIGKQILMQYFQITGFK